MDDLLLTDDEVVAVALDAGGRWPCRLPTVDLARDRHVREAAWRGRRSLAVRGLVGRGTPGDPLLDDVRRDVVDTSSVLALRVGVVAASRQPSSFEVNAYAGAADLLVETVSDHGVHGFTRLGHDAVVARMTGLAEQAFVHGVSDHTGAARLWISVVGAGRRPSLCLRAGQAELVDVEDDRVVAGSSRPVPDLAAAVARLADGIRLTERLVTTAGTS